MNEKTESKGSSNCAEVRVKFMIKGEIKTETSVSTNFDECCQNEDSVSKDKVDCDFEEFHENFDILTKEERSHENHREQTSILH